MSSNLTAAQEERAGAIHAEATLITCHDHIPPAVDLEPLRAGGVSARTALVVADVCMDAPDLAAFRASIAQREGWAAYARQCFAAAHAAVAAHAGALVLARSAGDIRHAKRTGKPALLLGSEGGKLVEGRLDLLREFYDLGLRQMQLTWAYSNQLAAGETERGLDEEEAGYFFAGDVRTGRAGGLTESGRAVVAEMNRLGIIVDVQHLSRPAMREVLALSTQPVIASHTSARALGKRLPCLGDAEIRAIADQGGVIGLHFMTHMLTGRVAPPATMEEVLAQIAHIVQIGGADVLALGPDYYHDPDGRFARNSGQQLTFAEGLEDVGKLPALTRALVGAGYSRQVIHNILGDNMLRVIEAVCG